MPAQTEHQKLQSRAKELGVPANQSSTELEKQIAKAERAEARKSEGKGAGKKAASHDKPRTSETGGAPTSEHGGVDPEWHNDPERVLDAAQLEEYREWEGRGAVEVSTFNPLSHNELTIDFTGLRPNTDFEVRITSENAAPYWVTLKSDPWGQSQLIWRTTAGGDYDISAKGPGVDVKGSFTVKSYDADADYRAAKRARQSKSGKKAARTPTAAVQSVEEPGVMGDTPSSEAKAQPTEDEANDPEKNEPAFKPAESQPVDGDEPDGRQKKTDGDGAGKEK